MSSESEKLTAISRRQLLLGGAAALAGSGVLNAQAISSLSGADGTDGVSTANELVAGSTPNTTTIATTPPSGTVVRNVNMYEFEPFNPAAQKTWGGSGIYSAGTATTMRAVIDIPAGATVANVEYYVYNNSGSAVSPDTYLYTPGLGTISSIGAGVSVPSAAAIAAYGVTPISQGPYPLGSMLLLSLGTPASGAVQINGGRVAFAMGAGATGLLPAPVRAYDSRSGDGQLAPGTLRTITLPSSLIVPGVAGVVANVTVVSAQAPGFLRIWPTGATEPASSSINYPASNAIANGAVLGVSSAGQINVRSQSSVDLIIDVTGIIA